MFMMDDSPRKKKELTPLAVSVLVGALATPACDVSDSNAAPEASGKADGFEQDPNASPDVYFVFSNGVVCNRAPCPHVITIGPDGEVRVLADVLFEDEDAQFQEGLFHGGIAVTGDIVPGPFDLPDEGAVLQVDEVVGQAQEYLVVDEGLRCNRAPCPMFSAYGDDGTQLTLSEVNVQIDPFSAESNFELAEQVVASEVSAIGWIREASLESPAGAGNTLYVSRTVEGIQTYEVASDPKKCFRAPCPQFRAVGPSDEITLLTEVNFGTANLSPDEQSAAIESLDLGTLVTGWIADGGELDFGNVLHVLEVREELGT